MFLKDLNNTLMSEVRAGRDIKLLKSLIADGADINYQDRYGWTPLMAAVFAGQENIVKMLLEHGAKTELKVFKEGWTAFRIAARTEKYDIAKMLVGHGADMNSQDSRGLTTLGAAVNDRQPKTVKFLLSLGVDPDIGSGIHFEASRPIFSIAGSGASDNDRLILKMLAEAGADMDSPDQEGLTPFLSSIMHAWEEDITVLLGELGADIKTLMYGEISPATAAASTGKYKVMLFLAERGEDLYKADLNGRTPVDIFREQNKEGAYYKEFLQGLNRIFEKKRLAEEDTQKKFRTGYEFDI